MAKKNGDKSAGNGSGGGKIEVRRQGGKIWSHLGQTWKDETPEERVRQEYLIVVIEE